MDKAQKKALTEAWKNRRPEMGVISLRCRETGIHPNKRLMELWRQYGEEGFEFSVAAVLDYEDPQEDHKEELETLRELCLAEDPQAVKLWK